MSKSAHIFFSSTGTTQAAKKLPALAPDTFMVDGRDTADQLAFTAKFAKALSYFNLQNKTDGNWQQILLEDPTILLAYIMKTDHSMAFPRYLDYKDGILRTTNENTKILFTQQFFSIGFHIILRINRWYKLSNQSLSHHPFRDYLQNIIIEEGRLALQAYYLLYFSLRERNCDFQNECLIKLEDLDKIWLFQPFPCVDKVLCGNDPKDLIEINDQVLKAVSAGQTLFHLQEKIIRSAGEYFQLSVQKSDIAPHVGLLLSFLDLLKYQQSDLNQLTESHLDFYFNDVLGFKPLDGQADSSFLVFQLAKGHSFFDLPQQSAFSAGDDAAGKPIVFASQNPIRLNEAELSQYLTLNFKHGLLASTSALAHETKTLEGLYGGTINQFDTISAPDWPFFGATKSIVPNFTVSEKTKDLGFAISCPDLLLASGQRSITFEFYKDKASKDEDYEGNLFDFLLTTAKGWMPVQGYCTSITIDGLQTCLEFKLKLDTNDPAIVPYNKKVHLPGFNTTWPICKITLAKGATQTAFETLRTFNINEIKVTCQVEDSKNLVLQNDKGKVSPKTPFYPFGNAPLPGGNLFMGSQELFAKPLKKLSLNIDWDHLPINFPAYYKAYPGVYTNEAFQAELSYFDLAKQQWISIKDDNKTTTKKPFSLFVSDEGCSGTKPLVLHRTITFPINAEIAQPDLPPVIAFTQALSSAFFKLTFTEPSQGFGNEDYPKVLAKITMENAQAIIWNTKNCQATDNCKSWEALYQGYDKFENLQVQFLGEISKIDQICILINDCIAQVCKVAEDCSLTNENMATAICEIVTTCKEQTDVMINNILTNINLIITQVYDIIIDLLPDFVKVASVSVSSTYAEDILNAFYSKIPTSTQTTIAEELKKIDTNLPTEIKALVLSLLETWIHSDKTKIEELVAKLVAFFPELSGVTPSIDAIFLTAQNEIPGCNSTLPLGPTKTSAEICEEVKTTLETIAPDLNTFKDAALDLDTLFEWLIKTTAIYLELENTKYVPLKPQPNKPFVPKTKALSVGYQSVSQWSATATSGNNLAFQFYHLEPYGQRQITIGDKNLPLFPNYKNIPYTLLGFKDMKPDEVMTILISITSQMKSISPLQVTAITYEYLREDGWYPLTLTADGTYDFEQNGIIQFLVPSNISDQSTVMPENLFWLRIGDQLGLNHKDKPAIPRPPIRTNFMATQAVSVQRSSPIQTTLQTIAAGTIKAPVKPISAIKKTVQPLPSTGRRAKETKPVSQQRTAYRLNNKNRAVTPKDMENLVLGVFENLYRVVTIPMNSYGPDNGRLVKIVAIPFTDIASKQPYRPLTPPAMLRNILNYCTTVSPPNIDLEVVNPDFAEVMIEVAVLFQNPSEEGLLTKQLNTELIKYLSPWLRENPFAAQPGDVLNSAAIRAFILSRPYIKTVGTLSLYQIIKEGLKKIKKIPFNEFLPLLKASNLVVSYDDHQISQLTKKEAALVLNDKATTQIPQTQYSSYSINN